MIWFEVIPVGSQRYKRYILLVAVSWMLLLRFKSFLCFWSSWPAAKWRDTSSQFGKVTNSSWLRSLSSTQLAIYVDVAQPRGKWILKFGVVDPKFNSSSESCSVKADKMMQSTSSSIVLDLGCTWLEWIGQKCNRSCCSELLRNFGRETSLRDTVVDFPLWKVMKIGFFQQCQVTCDLHPGSPS